jgi:hypothetical protein
MKLAGTPTVLLAFLPLPLAVHAQGAGIGTTTPNAAAALDIAATGKGLLIPRMDSAQQLDVDGNARVTGTVKVHTGDVDKIRLTA